MTKRTKQKIVTFAMVICVLALGAAGTLAYFADTADPLVNTFTVGNVEIELYESQYHRVNAGKDNATGEKEPLSGGYLWAADVDLQGTPENTPDAKNYTWTGTYFSDKQILDDAATYKAKDGYFETHSKLMSPGSNVRKNPYVKNTGVNPAYVRVRVLVPKYLFAVLDNGPSYWTSSALNDGVTSKAVDYYMAHNYTVSDEFKVTRDGVDYYEFDFTYPKPLEPGAVTFWNCWGNIAINPNATNEDLKNIPKEGFNVIIEADAIQSDGFADAAAAMAAFDAQTAAGN